MAVAFVLDPDGNNIEAVARSAAAGQEPARGCAASQRSTSGRRVARTLAA